MVRELALSYGVKAFYMEPKVHTDAFKRSVVSHLLNTNEITMNDQVILIGGSFGPRKGASFLEISKVSDMVYNMQ